MDGNIINPLKDFYESLNQPTLNRFDYTVAKLKQMQAKIRRDNEQKAKNNIPTAIELERLFNESLEEEAS